jgi:hypothetical protein
VSRDDALGDPWDRFITATAMALELPLVTRDRRITELRLVETIYYRRCLVSASAPRQDLVLDLHGGTVSWGVVGARRGGFSMGSP